MITLWGRVVTMIASGVPLNQMAVPTGAGRTPVRGMGSVVNSAAASAVVGIMEIRRMTTAIGRRRLLLDVRPFQTVVGDVRNVASAALDVKRGNSRRLRCDRK